MFDVDYKKCKGDLQVQKFGDEAPYSDYGYDAGVSISMIFGELLKFWGYFASLIDCNPPENKISHK